MNTRQFRYDVRVAIYDAIGGMAGCRRLAAAFYARVERDPVVRPLYPKSLHCAVDAIAMFLVQQFGGPCEYSENRATLSLYESHLRFAIGQAERDAWLRDMTAAMDDIGIGEPERAEMVLYFEQTSAYLINRPKPDRAPGVLVADDAIAALRRGDLKRVSELAGHPEYQRDRAAWVGLLGKMAASDDPRILEFALTRISADPGLAQERYGGSLLRMAAAAGCLAMVELLLRLGVDPNAVDRYGHPPLYFVGNQCRRESGPAVVRALVSGGANVNQQDRVKRCTPLHMAARRGNVAVAEALLEWGADPGIGDIAGVTPLQRALNCRKPEVAALLSASSGGR
uniref:Globin n=1 Tax=Solibacter usitatus (strain Ellin6076) TaxID=234267 RepID=Q020Z8_SOLUE